mgnify:CR=1 FL=1
MPPNIVEAAANTKMLGLVLFSMLFGFFLARIPQPQQGTVFGFWQGIFLDHDAHDRLRDDARAHRCVCAHRQGRGDFGIRRRGPLAAVRRLRGRRACCCTASSRCRSCSPLVARVNPWRLYPAMAPALLTAFSTASSSATLPLSLECLEKRAKVSQRIAGFVMPLGASMNHAGSALYECAAAMFIAQAYGLHLSFATQFTVVILALITSMGMAGIPAASLVGIAVILAAVGLPAEAIGVLLVFDRILDMCRTAINVLADAACTVIVARLEGETGVARRPVDPAKIAAVADRNFSLRRLPAGSSCPPVLKPAVDVEDLAGDAVGQIRAQERGGIAHVLERDVAAHRRDIGDAAQHLAKAGDAGGRQRLDGPRGDAVHANVVGPHVGREEAHVGLEARLGEAHDVVAGDRFAPRPR